LKLGINLICIPAGQTDRWQPLDHRIFGAVKARAGAFRNIEYGKVNPAEMNLPWGMGVVLDCWRLTTQEEVLAAFAMLE
jgi:hypothetical protein